MKLVQCVQGSAEWLAARRGIPTASRFGDILTAGGKASAGRARRTYMLELLAERLTGRCSETYVSAAMQRGTELEPRARAWWELKTGEAVTVPGFILSDGGRWGCSPDGITNEGGIEIKCPGLANHLEILLSRELPAAWEAQCQACMWITQRKTWDFVLWTDVPGVPCATWQIRVDAGWQASMEICLPVFCDELDEMERAIATMED